MAVLGDKRAAALPAVARDYAGAGAANAPLAICNVSSYMGIGAWSRWC